MSKVYLWGDSIGKGVVFNEERSRYCLCKDRATNLLIADGVDLDVHARMGAVITDGYADFEATETEPGSIGVIEFGGNDCDIDWKAVAETPDDFHDGRTPLPEFRAVLDTWIQRMRARGMKPILVTPPPLIADRYFKWVTRGLDQNAILNYLGDIEHIYRWQERYAQTVQEAAWRNQCALINLRELFLNERKLTDLMCIDGIHPNEAGQRLMAQAISAALPDVHAMMQGA